MSRKRKQSNHLEEYWKKRGFDSKKELLIYRYLCGNLSRWKAKKIDKTLRFREYKLWREHIECILQNYQEDELTEFYHFIRLKERKSGIGMEIVISLYFPITAAFIATFVRQYLVDMFQSFFENRISNTIKFIASFLGSAISLLVVMFGLVVLFCNAVYPYIGSKNETGFWADCLEIVEEKYKKER